MTIVVVGVSTSNGSPSALLAAAAEARWRNAELVAVQAWRPPRPPAAPGGHPPGVSRDERAAYNEAMERLHIQVARTLGDNAEILCKLVQGTARSVLVREAVSADLLVVSAPRTRANSPAVPLTRSLVSKANCPILIMPRDEADSVESALKRGSARFAAKAAQAAATAGRPGLRL